MEDIINETKPCLVQTSQGFSVSYKDKLLYSKYAPAKAITSYIEKLEILPQTLILCVSPILSYGLQELNQKLPADCIMLACEYDKALYDFMLDQPGLVKSETFSILSKEELLELGPLLTKRNATLQSGFTLPPCGTFRRIIRIDFSAGAQFSTQLYDKVLENATNALMTFWANRVTLVKFGRKYCTNFFKNLSILDRTTPLQNFFGKIEKPVLVFGAGETASLGIEKINKTGRSNYYILCADTALQPLLTSGISPDGVFIEEAQNVISKCFIGTKNPDIHIFAGLSSIHSITRFFKSEQISFFTTEFTQAEFLDRFDSLGILPPKNDPFGSVGITAYYYAILFRKDTTIPIYTFGLDFAYSAGRTHTKGTMADNARFMTSNRIKTDGNYAAAFNEPAFKKNKTMYTTPIMARYENLLMALRQAQEPQTLAQEPHIQAQEHQKEKSTAVVEPVETTNKITQILKEEVSSLQELKSLLTGEKQLPTDQLEKEITQLVQKREYLYLHFPDGHKFAYTQSFLNRVRVEIEYYLKILKR